MILGNRLTKGDRVLYSCTNKRTSAMSTCQQNGSWSIVGDLCNLPPEAAVPMVSTTSTVSRFSPSSATVSTSFSEMTTNPPTMPDISFSVTCIQSSAPDCGALPDGDYQSCSGCGYYATCGPTGVTTRTCPDGLVWDDGLKACQTSSSTCVETKK